MLKEMKCSDDTVKTISFDPIINQGFETIKIHEKVHEFAKVQSSGTIENIGDGFVAKSKFYTIVVLDQNVRINFYDYDDEDESSNKNVYHFIDVNMKAGHITFNINSWPKKIITFIQRHISAPRF